MNRAESDYLMITAEKLGVWNSFRLKTLKGNSAGDLIEFSSLPLE